MDKVKLDKYLKRIYSTVYSEPETPNFHVPLIQRSVEQFFNKMELKKDAKILDIGCGQGTFMREMEDRGYKEVVGITMSKDDVDACISKGYQAVYGDMSDLSYQDESWDMIWCRHALEHSPFPLLTLLEFNRVLKKGGFLYVEVPAPDTERDHEFNPNHFSVMGERMWASLFGRSGFQGADQGIWEFKMSDGKSEKQEKFFGFLMWKKNAIDYSKDGTQANH
jgi:ubiquinone/menaquinone biosynthesis C-methylase UbiE